MPTVTGDRARAVLICVVITAGLGIDQHVPQWGQAAVSVAVAALLLYWVVRAPAPRQVMLIACVVYAALGEGVLSLVWGLYDYRLGNVPAFVPPGHALLLMLGLIVASRVRDWVTWFVPLAALPFIALLAWLGRDTFGLLLYALLVLCMVFSGSRKLYAVMFVLSLAMEVYGTWMGNWAWHADVPWLRLSTTNPPIAAGAFYCVLDLLVMSTLRVWRRRAAALPA